MITNLRDAKAHLSLLVQRAAAGEEIIITVHGRPTARITAAAAPAASATGVHTWMQELAAGAEAARCGEPRSTPQEAWEEWRSDRS